MNRMSDAEKIRRFDEMMNQYRKPWDGVQNELAHYASDLNKFLAKESEKYPGVFTKTVINADCIIYKHFDKGKIKRIRMIESKHWNEPLKEMQSKVYDIMAQIAKETTVCDYDIYLVAADYPFQGPIKIQDLTHRGKNGNTKIFYGKKQFIKWLNFEIEFVDLNEDQHELFDAEPGA